MQQKDFAGVGESAVYGLGSGIGWLLAILAIASLMALPVVYPPPYAV